MALNRSTWGGRRQSLNPKLTHQEHDNSLVSASPVLALVAFAGLATFAAMVAPWQEPSLVVFWWGFSRLGVLGWGPYRHVPQEGFSCCWVPSSRLHFWKLPCTASQWSYMMWHCSFCARAPLQKGRGSLYIGLQIPGDRTCESYLSR